MSLYNSKKALWQATRLTSHSNCYLIIGNYPIICYLVKIFIKKFVFYKQLRKSNDRINLSNLFANSNALLTKKILLAEYKNSSWDN